MPRKPKPYSVYVLQYKSSYSLKEKDLSLNPSRHSGRPIISIHYTTKPVLDEIAKKKAGQSQIKRARPEPRFNRRFSRKQGVLRCQDELIVELRKSGWTVLNRPSPINFCVYCLELREEARPSEASNLNLPPNGLPVLYVGQTGKKISERIKDHLSGKNCNKWVRDYFVRERSDLVATFSMTEPMTERKSLQSERSLAQRLRDDGYVVRGGH